MIFMEKLRPELLELHFLVRRANRARLITIVSDELVLRAVVKRSSASTKWLVSFFAS